jgi:hypothetical protein
MKDIGTLIAYLQPAVLRLDSHHFISMVVLLRSSRFGVVTIRESRKDVHFLGVCGNISFLFIAALCHVISSILHSS